jgi:hypothetical protein
VIEWFGWFIYLGVAVGFLVWFGFDSESMVYVSSRQSIYLFGVVVWVFVCLFRVSGQDDSI